MRGPLTQVLVHIVWATWDRLPLIVPNIEDRLVACLADEARGLRCSPMAIGGMADHVHVLIAIHPTVAVARLVQQLKGVSSHLINHELDSPAGFKWQGAYGAFSVSPDAAPFVARYIALQKQHHAKGTLHLEWETMEEW
ncbi:MAG: IS200/IS605 family transposase [Chloroflexota bacterium]